MNITSQNLLEKPNHKELQKEQVKILKELELRVREQLWQTISKPIIWGMVFSSSGLSSPHNRFSEAA